MSFGGFCKSFIRCQSVNPSLVARQIVFLQDTTHMQYQKFFLLITLSALLMACADQPLRDPVVVSSDPGKTVYETKACNACHSSDGTTLSGPSFLNLFGSQVALADGTTVTADEAYLKESITNPSAKIVKGFPNVMPSYVFSDADFAAFIAYIKTLKAP